MKLWDKGISPNEALESFTVGKDRELDLFLAPFDVIGSLAHVNMLCKIGLLSQEDYDAIQSELRLIYEEIEKGNFTIEDQIEDVHSQVELILTQKLGDTGKRVHSGRSRNDQVLVDLKLFFVAALKDLVKEIENLFHTLQLQSETYKEVLMPGYTHTQVAMPSSFGLWFGSYAENLIEDLHFFLAAFRVVDQNPLGSAAGYGSSFPLDRRHTTKLLGFSTLSYNVVHAQMGRGKTERSIAFALASLGSTLNKMATDVCLYMSQNFAFVSLPDELTTGSSIMPHKKNPDGFEILRAKSNRLQALPAQLSMITTNLSSGYHRDLQLTKELVLPGIFEAMECLQMANLMIKEIKVNPHLLEKDTYKYIFSVEAVNKYVLEGMSFREAYKKIGKEIQEGSYQDAKSVAHTHEGSIGQLCKQEILEKFQKVRTEFSFKNFESAWEKLLKG
ncbi:MAG: argininosuccinate lyase [Bacteroidia bacterium]|nr:argininosuccinate lyase [Bacteroidia bacterium]